MATDLFGMEVAPRRNMARPEAACLVEVLLALKNHPKVAWAERMNSGCARVGGRFIRFGFVGCPDILGQLRDGRLLACEVKARSGRPSPEQIDFLHHARDHKAVAFIAHDCADVFRELGPL